MNGFPYWQFHNERWLTGKASSLDLDAQGLFLYFCMAAWASRGAFNICQTSVRLRFRKSAEWIADTLGVMVEIGILIEDGEKYRIKFIDEQIAEMNAMREKRSKAGKASAESRHNTRYEYNTKEEVTKGKVRKGKVTTVLESVQHGLNKCSTHVDAPKPPAEPIKAPPKQEAAIPECLATVEGFADAFAAWVEFRAAKRAKATERVKATILKRLSERPEQAVAALDTCMAAGWTDVRWDWIDNRNRAHTGDPRNAKPGGFYDSGSPEDAWPELTAAERRADELERRAK
jgi:hypothetical protein